MKNQKLILGMAALALVGYGAYKLASQNNYQTVENTFDPESNFTPQTVADQLYDAMKGIGTDEDAIYQALTDVTQDMFAQVINAFGVKPYNTILGNQSGFFLNSYDLKFWLKEELSDGLYQTLKLKYPNFL